MEENPDEEYWDEVYRKLVERRKDVASRMLAQENLTPQNHGEGQAEPTAVIPKQSPWYRSASDASKFSGDESKVNIDDRRYRG